MPDIYYLRMTSLVNKRVQARAKHQAMAQQSNFTALTSIRRR